MNQKQIVKKLRSILNCKDIERGKLFDEIINRKKSIKHTDELEVLLEHISILVSYLEYDLDTTKRELNRIRKSLE